MTPSQVEEEEEDVRCANCGDKEDAVDNLGRKKYQINKTCLHYFCHRCTQREFSRRPRFTCQACAKQGKETEVLKANLESKTREEVQCGKDTYWRQRVLEVFGKNQEDFATLDEYNDYLEGVEDRIYILSNRHEVGAQEVERVEAELKEERKKNEAEIARLKAKKELERRQLASQVEAEKKKRADDERRRLEEDMAEKQNRAKFKLESMQFRMGERESFTVRPDGTAAENGSTAASAMEVEDDDDERTEAAMANIAELGISTFHTNLQRLVGPQPRIVEDKSKAAKAADLETMGRASGFGAEKRALRLWHEAVSSLFLTSTASRERVLSFFG